MEVFTFKDFGVFAADSTVIWEDKEKQIYEYDTAEEAQKGADNMKMAFGNQIQFTCVRRKVQA